jgi:hypothetical protein
MTHLPDVLNKLDSKNGKNLSTRNLISEFTNISVEKNRVIQTYW